MIFGGGVIFCGLFSRYKQREKKDDREGEGPKNLLRPVPIHNSYGREGGLESQVTYHKRLLVDAVFEPQPPGRVHQGLDLARVVDGPRKRRLPAGAEEALHARQALEPHGQRAQLVKGELPLPKVVDDLAHDAADRRRREVHEVPLGEDQRRPAARGDVAGPAGARQIERPEGVVPVGGGGGGGRVVVVGGGGIRGTRVDGGRAAENAVPEVDDHRPVDVDPLRLMREHDSATLFRARVGKGGIAAKEDDVTKFWMMMMTKEVVE